MSNEPGWVHEGHVLDDAGSLIVTTYVDLRDVAARPPIPALVKGCKREHALEDGETILISKPEWFRECGEGLIQDEQEGLARGESVTAIEETPAHATRRRSIADINEAHELLDSRVRSVQRVTHSEKRTKSRSLSFGKEWWIFCTSIEPGIDGWESWKGTLDEEYDHVSYIGQPAKFAEALARMVTEQIGPQGKDGWIKDTTEGSEGARTKHRTQWVMHRGGAAVRPRSVAPGSLVPAIRSSRPLPVRSTRAPPTLMLRNVSPIKCGCQAPLPVLPNQ